MGQIKTNKARAENSFKFYDDFKITHFRIFWYRSMLVSFSFNQTKENLGMYTWRWKILEVMLYGVTYWVGFGILSNGKVPYMVGLCSSLIIGFEDGVKKMFEPSARSFMWILKYVWRQKSQPWLVNHLQWITSWLDLFQSEMVMSFYRHQILFTIPNHNSILVYTVGHTIRLVEKLPDSFLRHFPLRSNPMNIRLDLNFCELSSSLKLWKPKPNKEYTII